MNGADRFIAAVEDFMPMRMGLFEHQHPLPVQQAQLLQQSEDCHGNRAVGPVFTLDGDADFLGGDTDAKDPFSSALGNQVTAERPHQLRVKLMGASYIPGMLAHCFDHLACRRGSIFLGHLCIA